MDANGFGIGLMSMRIAGRFGKYVIILLDPQDTMCDLHEVLHNACGEINCTFMWKFRNSVPCISALTQAVDILFIFILPSDLAETIIPLIHDVPQLVSIYIYGDRSNTNIQCDRTWEKIKGFFSNETLLFDQLKVNDRNDEQNSIPISIILPYSEYEPTGIDQSFMYTQLVKEILLSLKYDENSKKIFFKYARLKANGKKCDLEEIDECEKNYEQRTPIHWYATKSFFYDKLNLALRKQDMSYVVKMGFYLQDLHRQIQHIHGANHLNQKFTVYRGQGISQEDFEKLKHNVNGLLTFNSFLSTTTDRDVAHGFASSSLNKSNPISIIFEMKIDSTISSTPFATVGNHSPFVFENEILFSIPTVFRIDSLHEVQEKLWQVYLTITSDTDNHIRSIAEYIRYMIHEATGLNRLAWLLIKMGEFDQAEEICDTIREMTDPNNWEELCLVYHQLGYICEHKENISLAISHYRKAIETTIANQPWNIYRRGSTIRNLISLILMNEISNDDLEACQSLIKDAYNTFANCTIIEHHSFNAYQYLAKCTSERNLKGREHKNKGEYMLALECYNDALKILRLIPFYTQELAVIYCNIGALYITQENYSEALLNFQKTLHIETTIFPPTHPTLITTYTNLAETLASLSRYKEAKDHQLRAVNIANIRFGKDHPKTKKLLNRFYDYYRSNRHARPLTVLIEGQFLFHGFM